MHRDHEADNARVLPRPGPGEAAAAAALKEAAPHAGDVVAEGQEPAARRVGKGATRVHDAGVVAADLGARRTKDCFRVRKKKRSDPSSAALLAAG